LLIRIDCSEYITHLHIKIALRKDRFCYTVGFFGYIGYKLWMQSHQHTFQFLSHFLAKAGLCRFGDSIE
jgi:hypothetical protein